MNGWLWFMEDKEIKGMGGRKECLLVCSTASCYIVHVINGVLFCILFLPWPYELTECSNVTSVGVVSNKHFQIGNMAFKKAIGTQWWRLLPCSHSKYGNLASGLGTERNLYTWSWKPTGCQILLQMFSSRSHISDRSQAQSVNCFHTKLEFITDV